MALLELSGLSKKFGSVHVLKNVNISVDRKEVVVILGKSGIGKTTLIKLVCGILAPDYGNIKLEVNKDTDKTIFNGIGYVPQSPSLLSTKSVEDNIKLPLKLTNKKGGNIRELVKLLGLQELLHKYPSQLSRGQAQRVSLARAMILNPSLLVLDEPFASIDEMSKEDLDSKLINLIDKYNVSILMVTHSIEEAVYIADKILVLKKNGTYSIHKINFRVNRRSPEIKMLDEFFNYQKEVREALL